MSLLIPIAYAADVLIFSDSFTVDPDNVALEDHAGMETGTSWTVKIQNTCGPSCLNIDENDDFVACDDAGLNNGAAYTAQDSYSTANYYVQVDNPAMDTGDDYSWLFIRFAGVNDFYTLRYVTGAGQLFKATSATGAFLPLESQQSDAGIADGEIMYLEGDGTTISWGFGDRSAETHTEVSSVTDTSHSSAGEGGLGMGDIFVDGSDCGSSEMDNFKVYTTTAAPPAVTEKVNRDFFHAFP